MLIPICMCICCRTCICDCDLPGLWGTGNGTTSYSENIGAIGVTKVDSCTVACGLHCGTKQNMATSLTIKAACFFSVFKHTNYLDKFGSIKIIFNHFNLKSTPVLNGNSCNTYNSQNSNKCNKYNSTPLPLLACIWVSVFWTHPGWKQKGGAVGGRAHDAFWHFQQVWWVKHAS